MATKPRRSRETAPTFKQSGKAIGEVMESAAAMMGHGMAVVAEGAGQLADKAADMAGVSPAPVTRVARDAGRTVTRGARRTRQVAASAARATARELSTGTRRKAPKRRKQAGKKR
jgi:hypothetical protein